VAGYPLSYLSNNAPKKRDVLGAILLSVLEGQSRYAHMSSLANAELDARTLDLEKIPCEDSIRDRAWANSPEPTAA